MQTFLPFEEFYLSACCLDRQRLNSQRREAFQILHSLRDNWAIYERAWRVGRGLIVPWTRPRDVSRHPAARMWNGYEEALRAYYNQILSEWERRGYRNTMRRAPVESSYLLPHWLGDERLHRSHRSALLRKDPAWYGRFGWEVPDDLPYYWPAV